MESKYRYNEYISNKIREIILYNSDGSKYKTIEFVHCCEVIKDTINFIDKVELKQLRGDINYTDEEIERWYKLIKEYGAQFDYEVKDKYAIITLHNRKYKTSQHQYLSMVLARYPWYMENDGLIDRIFDMLDNGISFDNALYMSHYYDKINRDSTFNLNFTKTLFRYRNESTANPFIWEFKKGMSLNNHYFFNTTFKTIDSSSHTIRDYHLLTVNNLLVDYLHNLTKTNDYFQVLNEWKNLTLTSISGVISISIKGIEKEICESLIKYLAKPYNFKEVIPAGDTIEVGTRYINIHKKVIMKVTKVTKEYIYSDYEVATKNNIDYMYKIIE